MLCNDPNTRAARLELRQLLAADFRYELQLPVPPESASAVLRDLIFHWDYVAPTARFIYAVAKTWRWFGNVLPTIFFEDEPGSDTDVDGTVYYAVEVPVSGYNSLPARKVWVRPFPRGTFAPMIIIIITLYEGLEVNFVRILIEE
ncbi:hypothetical protein GGX14DRAFT_403394 [Mycena pura]|uniref:Uncharacterized protein n=1 Tax=Mycena pura TaxID=153505 RepID=A0AAD6Y8F3_9AGAR|nr:hypothetical protein GGX14DRAFT_403394 [Mycena pura]